MKFVVRKTKSTYLEDEYHITLTDKTKQTIKRVYVATCLVSGVYLVRQIMKDDSPKTENDPETTKSN